MHSWDIMVFVLPFYNPRDIQANLLFPAYIATYRRRHSADSCYFQPEGDKSDVLCALKHPPLCPSIKIRITQRLQHCIPISDLKLAEILDMTAVRKNILYHLPGKMRSAQIHYTLLSFV